MAGFFDVPSMLALGGIAAIVLAVLFGVHRFQRRRLVKQASELIQIAAGYAGYDLADLAQGRSPSPEKLVAAIKKEHELLIRRGKNIFARLPDDVRKRHGELLNKAIALLDATLEGACSGKHLTQEDASRITDQYRKLFREGLAPLIIGKEGGGFNTDLSQWTIEATEWAGVAFVFGDGKTKCLPDDPEGI